GFRGFGIAVIGKQKHSVSAPEHSYRNLNSVNEPPKWWLLCFSTAFWLLALSPACLSTAYSVVPSLSTPFSKSHFNSKGKPCDQRRDHCRHTGVRRKGGAHAKVDGLPHDVSQDNQKSDSAGIYDVPARAGSQRPGRERSGLLLFHENAVPEVGRRGKGDRESAQHDGIRVVQPVQLPADHTPVQVMAECAQGDGAICDQRGAARGVCGRAGDCAGEAGWRNGGPGLDAGSAGGTRE